MTVKQYMTLFVLSLILILAACGQGESSTPPLSESITCTAAYRAAVTGPLEAENTFTFSNEDREETLSFDALTLRAVYRNGAFDGERNLLIQITASADDRLLQTQLYQLSLESGPANQFVGGHGFTGLNYSYAPESGAELQYWCVAE
ncbi:MAG: hypothetical protein AAF633_23270 [Chloroflexota bacterium]